MQSPTITGLVSLRALLLGGAVAALLAPMARAENIDTTGAWNGTSFISSWGLPNTATYGQTITPTTGQTRLNGFTFYLEQTSGVAPQYQAFVYEWNPGTQRIVGPALFTSGVLTAPGGSGFVPVHIDTGTVILTPGTEYVLFLTTSSVAQGGSSSYQYGSVANATYAGGQFVFQNNGTTFGNLSTTSWNNIQQDLAFIWFLQGLLFPELPPGAPTNPGNLATALDTFTTGGGAVPVGLLPLYGLTGQPLADALSEIVGENNTQAQQGAFTLNNHFLSLLTGPSGSTANGPGGGPAMPFAPEQPRVSPSDAVFAYASTPEAAASGLPSSDPRWNVWGAAFGGSNSISGDPAGVGSHNSTISSFAFSAGADTRLLSGGVVGVSLAVGGTSWGLSGGLGGGHSDAFLAGLYGSKEFGAAYLSGALSFGLSSVSTSRNITLPGTDTLRASFNAQSFGGRVEAGYKLRTSHDFNTTPYAAVQLQTYHSPAYSETGLLGSPDPFALTYAAHSATATRTEVGARFDKVFARADGDLALFGGVAWAHDWQSAPALNAAFVGLPTTTFVVNGAAPPSDLGLVTAGAEWRNPHGWAVMTKFDGAFGNGFQSYAGTVRAKYSW